MIFWTIKVSMRSHLWSWIKLILIFSDILWLICGSSMSIQINLLSDIMVVSVFIVYLLV